MNERHTADGEPIEDRGIADSAIAGDTRRSEDMQGDDDFESTNATAEKLIEKQ
jgi:hypothetical protein